MKRKSKVALLMSLAVVLTVPITLTHDAFMHPLVKEGKEVISLEKQNTAFNIHKSENLQILMKPNEGYVAIKQGESYDRDSFIKVPSKYKDTFVLEIDGTVNGEPIKIYAGADERTQLNTKTFKIPSKIFTNDLNIYNEKFIKVTDNSSDTIFYINMDEVKWKSITGSKLKVIGTGDNRSIIAEGERNLTMQLNSRTNLSADDLHKITAGTGLEGIEDALVETENKYGVNSIFILSVAIHESGWGSSYLARTRNNLFGICAYDNNVDAASGFSSKAECVDYFGRLISKEYFPEGRTTLDSINAIYASNNEWSSNVYESMSNIINRI